MLHIAMYLFYLAPLINLRLHYTGSIIAAFFLVRVPVWMEISTSSNADPAHLTAPTLLSV